MWALRFPQVSTLLAVLACTAVHRPVALFAQGIESLSTVADTADIPPQPMPARDLPLSALPPETRGDLLMLHGNYAAALAVYQQSSPPSAVLLNKIGVAYHHLFALEEARKYYQRAIHFNPHYAEALNNLAAVYHGEHNYKQAEKFYRQSLKFAPDSALTYKNLGTTYLSDEKYKQGAEAYRKALALNPSVFEGSRTQPISDAGSRGQRAAVDYYQAKMYAASGNTDQALFCLRKALDAGFGDRRRVLEDKDFAQLRDMPEFQKMLEQLPAHRSRG
jgi:tetratricopeptide (TPR) repeat protein